MKKVASGKKIQTFLPAHHSKVKTIPSHIAERNQEEKALRRSEQEAKRLAWENTIIAEIGRIISSTLEIEEVYEKFAETVKKLIPFDRLVITIINPEGGKISNAYVSGVGVPGFQVGNIAPLAGSFSEEIARTRKGILIQAENQQEFTDHFPQILSTFQVGLRSMISVPLSSKDQVIGVLHIHSLAANAYTDVDMTFAEKVGTQIAGAITHAHLFQERAMENLRKQDERYRNILGSMEEGYFEVDLAGNFTFVNDVTCRHIGYSRAELIGMNNRQYTDKETAKKVFEAFSKVYRTGEPVKILDEEIIRKDGVKAIFEISVSLIRDSGGKPIGFRGIARDVTDRKRAEEALRKSEEKYRQVVDNATEGILIAQDGRARLVNSKMLGLLGYNVDEVESRSFIEFIHPDDRELVLNRHLRRLAGETVPEVYEFRLLAKDGRSPWVEIRSVRIEWDGRPATLNMLANINDRKRAEEALQRSEEEAKRLAQENAIVAEIGRIISSTLNIAGVYELFSQEVQKLISFERCAFTTINSEDRTAATVYASGIGIPTRLPGEVFPLAGSGTEKAQQAKSALIIKTEDENEVAARVPGLLPIFKAGIRSVMMIPLISRDQVIGVLNLQSIKPDAYTEKELRIAERVGNQIAGGIANAQLFAELKRAEEALRGAQEILETRVQERTVELVKANDDLEAEIMEHSRTEEELNKAKEAAEAASRAKSEFLANMSHELRTPLNHIIGFTELVVDKQFGALNKAQEEYLNDVLHSSRHLLSLINDILDLSKVEAGKLELEVADVNLRMLLENSLTMVKEKALKHRIRLAVDMDGVPDTIHADERKLRQIMYNLLSNAVKFTPDGGAVTLSARHLTFKAGYALTREGGRRFCYQWGAMRGQRFREV